MHQRALSILMGLFILPLEYLPTQSYSMVTNDYAASAIGDFTAVMLDGAYPDQNAYLLYQLLIRTIHKAAKTNADRYEYNP